MNKLKIRPRGFLYPMPIVLVGTMADGKPNYITVSYCGVINHQPPLISISIGKSHYTMGWIEKNGSFSINIPSTDMVEQVDYCGSYTGKGLDKSAIFKNFYGDMRDVPMINECPLNMECRVQSSMDCQFDMVFIAQVTAVYCKEEFMTEGHPDMSKIQPIIFSMYDNKYWSLGEVIGNAWSIGKNFHRELVA